MYVCMYICMYICMYLQSANEKLDLQVKEQLEKHIKLEVHTHYCNLSTL